jgi:hypothetical protein
VILKPIDDKSKRLALLEDLQKSPLLDVGQKKWLREELVRTRKGIQGEKESAFYLDSYFKASKNVVVLHDLRFEFGGDVAQLDHLIFNRTSDVFLVETKNYAGNLLINDAGEFTVDYGEAVFGIPSPIEQSHRHERVLRRLFERLEITTRTGASMSFHHVVMVHPKARITRPPNNAFDTSNVIKGDQFPTWYQNFFDEDLAGASGALRAMHGLMNIRSSDTVVEWAEKLKRQHRTANLIALPEFMQPRERPRTPAVKPAAPESPTSSAPETRRVAPPAAADMTAEGEPQKRLICMTCNQKISFAEGKFCWNNPQRFGGLQYCRVHQQGL